MPTFLYKGFTQEGTHVGGSKKFKSMEEMQKYTETLDIERVQIFESKTKYSTKPYKYIDQKDLSIFCKQMSVVFFSHVTTMEGLLLLAGQNINKELTVVLLEIYDIMDKGYTFSETIAMYDHVFDKYLINMILIGESSGTLDRVFSDMSDYFYKESIIRKKVKAATIYPAVLAVTMFTVIMFLVNSILPMFDSMLISMGSTQSLVTGIVIDITRFLEIYGLIFVAVLILLALGLKYYFKTEKGVYVFDKLKMTVPGVRYITTRIILTRIARSLAILLKSGTQILNATEQVTILVDNKYLEDKFKTAFEEIKKGKQLSEAFEEMDIFPKLFIKMILIGETTGNLDIMLEKSSYIFEDEASDAIDRITRLIEPILIAILSIIVGTILLAIMIPMIDIMQSI